MKLIATALASILILGLPAGLLAQTSGPSRQPSGGSSPPSDQPAAGGSGSTTSSGAPAATPGRKSSGPGAASGSSNTQVTTPGAPSGRAGDTNVQIDRDDTPAASPRTSGSETRIFGLSPLVAVLIAAALLVVVILAIVSMSRGASTHSERIDVDRRL